MQQHEVVKRRGEGHHMVHMHGLLKDSRWQNMRRCLHAPSILTAMQQAPPLPPVIAGHKHLQPPCSLTCKAQQQEQQEQPQQGGGDPIAPAPSVTPAAPAPQGARPGATQGPLAQLCHQHTPPQADACMPQVEEEGWRGV
jgi:hypothetical protein